jgi:hypothetical protein
MVNGLKEVTHAQFHSLQVSTPCSRTVRSLRLFRGGQASKTPKARTSQATSLGRPLLGNWLGARRAWVFKTKAESIDTACGVGGRFLLGPLRRATTAQALRARSACPSSFPRSPSLCYGLRCGPPHSAGLSVALATHPARWVQLQKKGGEVQTQ